MKLINITFAVSKNASARLVSLLSSEIIPAMAAHGYRNLLLSRVVPPEETDGAESDAIALQGRVHSTDVHYRFLENGPLGTIHAKVGERIPMFITELDVVFGHNTDK